MYMSSPGCSPLGPEPVIPAMWKYPFATFMLDQVCGGASATLGDRIVFMLKGPSCKRIRSERGCHVVWTFPSNSSWRLSSQLATRKRIVPRASRWKMGRVCVRAVIGGISASGQTETRVLRRKHVRSAAGSGNVHDRPLCAPKAVIDPKSDFDPG